MDTRISSRTSVVVAIIAAVLAMLWAPAAARPGDITEYTLPSENSRPLGITTGPDGNVWFTEMDGNRIGRIDPATGAITEFPLPTVVGFGGPGGIAAGPDGNMWFTAGAIGRITSRGRITHYPVPNGDPHSIAAGPDGNMWFTEPGGDKIGRITPHGDITEYKLPTTDSYPNGIAAGPDGNMWFTERGVPDGGWSGSRIGRIDPRGRITEYRLPTAKSAPTGIAAGPDGNMWFTEPGMQIGLLRGRGIGRITPRGRITMYPVPFPWGQNPSEIVAGPDGNLWFTEPDGNRIGRINPATGAVAEYPVWPGHPFGIAAGPDGNLWFTEYNANTIGRITPGGRPEGLKKPCPMKVVLHTPAPTKVGDRILTDKITTGDFCVLPKSVVRCRPRASSTAGKKAFCATKVTKRGTIRVNTKGYEAVRVSLIVRAKPKPDFADSWKPNTWRTLWLLR